MASYSCWSPGQLLLLLGQLVGQIAAAVQCPDAAQQRVVAAAGGGEGLLRPGQLPGGITGRRDRRDRHGGDGGLRQLLLRQLGAEGVAVQGGLPRLLPGGGQRTAAAAGLRQRVLRTGQTGGTRRKAPHLRQQGCQPCAAVFLAAGEQSGGLLGVRRRLCGLLAQRQIFRSLRR